jgi:lipopolysaccharide transport system permease protein
MWNPELLGDSSLARLFLGLNPFYHLLQIVRLPILGTWPTWENWTLSLVSCVVGWSAVYFVSKKYKNRIAFWV